MRLRLPTGEIGRLTPALWHHLLRERYAEDEVRYLQTGILASVMANSMSGKRKDGRSWEPSDFMPRSPFLSTPQVPSARAQTLEEQMAAIERIKAAWGVG